MGYLSEWAYEWFFEQAVEESVFPYVIGVQVKAVLALTRGGTAVNPSSARNNSVPAGDFFVFRNKTAPKARAGRVWMIAFAFNKRR